MTNKFKKLNLDCFISKGVSFEDKRISQYQIDDHTKKSWSCMYGHLDMIYDFYYKSNKDFCIFCEDDILIHKDIKHLLPVVISDFQDLDLDVLLLGYLLRSSARMYSYLPQFTQIKANNNIFEYYNYSNDVWGTQMYMLSRKHAKAILNKYYSSYAQQTLTNKMLTPFSADWTITKDGKRALIYPILSIEDGSSEYADESQKQYHASCFVANYIPDIYV